MTLLIISLLVVSLCVDVITAASGTTPHFETIFKGRCWDYDATRTGDMLPRVNTSCDVLWSHFSSAFTYEPSCNVTLDEYAPFIEKASQAVPRDKSLFWSATYGLVHKFSQKGQRLVTLEDTLIGYMIDALVWCGQKETPGINYDTCPDWGECEGDAKDNFWIAASTAFAHGAKGTVTVFLSGSNPAKPAYRPDSYFGKHELQNLNVNEVSKVHVIVSHDLDKPKLETCGTGSLLLMKQHVTARGLKFTCQNDPPSVMHMLCSDNPTSLDCQTFYDQICGGNSASTTVSLLRLRDDRIYSSLLVLLAAAVFHSSITL